MNNTRPTPVLPAQRAFTLVEVLVSMTVLSLLLVVLVQLTGATQKTYTSTVGKIEQFRDARQAFEAMTRRLSQATLNTYWDYYPPLTTSTSVPSAYVRQSELRFISGSTQTLLPNYTNRPTHAIFFQAPLGMVSDTADYHGLDNLLNTWGYCIEFGDDVANRPPFLTSLNPAPAAHYRYRLMELQEPSDSFSLYQKEAAMGNSSATPPIAGNPLYFSTTWFSDPSNSYLPLGAIPSGASSVSRPVHVLADNIVALILLPKLSREDQNSNQNSGTATGAYDDTSLCPYYLYDSTSTSNSDGSTLHNLATTAAALNPKNQLPAVVQVTMVAVDELSYARLQGTQTAAPSLFPSTLFGPQSASSTYTTDLQTLQNDLQTKRLNYRVFTTDVSIKAAKWSVNQTN